MGPPAGIQAHPPLPLRFCRGPQQDRLVSPALGAWWAVPSPDGASQMQRGRVPPWSPELYCKLLETVEHAMGIIYSCAWFFHRVATQHVARNCSECPYFTFTFHFHTLEKEMAAHFGVLAWRFPGMGGPGGLPSMGSHRVGHH